MNKRHKMKKMSRDDLIYEIITKLFLVIVMIVILYPVYFVLVASFSDPIYVNSGEMLFGRKDLHSLGISVSLKTAESGLATATR